MPNKTLIAIVVVLAGLAGCNAGGPAASETAVQGTRITGAVQYGRVTLSVIGERSIRQIASARTDAEGAFDMALPQELSQPLLLEVKPASDGRSRMICDSDGGCGDYARGQAMPLPDSFRMLALVGPSELRGRALSINPYTHMATYETARLPGLLDETAINVAREHIARGYGIGGGFWQGSATSGAEERRVRGVALTSVSDTHRLVIEDGLLRIRGDLADAGCDGTPTCAPARVASVDAGRAENGLWF